MTFSRVQALLDAVTIKVRRAKIQARLSDKDFKAKHPDWCRDAAKGDYTLLIKKITEDTQKKQVRNATFTLKLHEVSK